MLNAFADIWISEGFFFLSLSLPVSEYTVQKSTDSSVWCANWESQCEIDQLKLNPNLKSVALLCCQSAFIFVCSFHGCVSYNHFCYWLTTGTSLLTTGITFFFSIMNFCRFFCSIFSFVAAYSPACAEFCIKFLIKACNHIRCVCGECHRRNKTVQTAIKIGFTSFTSFAFGAVFFSRLC